MGSDEGKVLVDDNHTCSFTENRIPDKLELTLSNMSGILLFSMFISHMVVPSPAETPSSLPTSHYIVNATFLQVIVAALAEAASLTAYRSFSMMNATLMNATWAGMGYNGGV